VQGEAANHPSSINKTETAYAGFGVPAAKMGAGVGAYGHCWKGITGPNQSLASASETGGDNTLPFSKIMASYYNASLYNWDASALAGYLSSSTAFGPSGCTYLTYDTPQGVTAKAQYVIAHGMGGIMFWTIDQQYIAGGASGAAQNPLLNAAMTGLGNP
jgi:chitinase